MTDTKEWCIKFVDRRGNVWYYHEIECDRESEGYPVQVGCTPFKSILDADDKLTQIKDSYKKFGLTDGNVVPKNWEEYDFKL